MNAKTKNIVSIFLIVSFVAITVAILFPNVPTLPLFSLYLFVVLGIQFVWGPAAYMLMAPCVILGVYSMGRVNPDQVLAIPILILTLFGCAIMIHFHLQKINMRIHFSHRENDDREKEKRSLGKEISFYESRLVELNKRADQRSQLVKATREMGSLLDPTLVQNKLIETTQMLFPGRPVTISYGQNQDSIDSYVIQKKQPLLVPAGQFKGNPLLAAPITSRRSVAGILRVGGTPGAPYTREDLRFLEILASLASMALDNTMLFNQVEQTALRDGLTGLLTHRAFQDVLDAQVLEASRFGHPLSIILTDVDHFKSVNDNHGHQAGDQVLQGFSHVLIRNVREVDVVARYGGEEFVILLLQTPHEAALQVAEHMRQDISSQEFEVGKKSISITGSFGVATFPQDATSPQQLIRQADQRLYQAKESGRNRVHGR